MAYKCRHFDIEELVPPQFLRALVARFGPGAEVRAWEYLDNRMLATIDNLRDRYGPIYINSWAHNGGPLSECGLRDPLTTTGALYSFHKFGKAFDLHFTQATPIEVQKELVMHPDTFPLITCLEDAEVTKSWLHCDNRNHSGHTQLIIVRP